MSVNTEQCTCKHVHLYYNVKLNSEQILISFCSVYSANSITEYCSFHLEAHNRSLEVYSDSNFRSITFYLNSTTDYMHNLRIDTCKATFLWVNGEKEKCYEPTRLYTTLYT